MFAFFVTCLFIVLATTSCTALNTAFDTRFYTTKEQKIDNFVKAQNFDKKIKKGLYFKHVLLINSYLHHTEVDKNNTNETLHIYIEGDGKAWLTPTRVALDPSSEDNLMLHLMALDKSPSIYLGRPCYMGLYHSKNCNPWYWTTGRYSEEVIFSMREVLSQFLEKHKFKKLIFMGHSGGGTLAMLLAPKFTETTMVVTIAGNLDTEKWVEHHKYSALSGLNPINNIDNIIDKDILQYHFMGQNDEVAPHQIMIKPLKGKNNTQYLIIPEYDHTCCWDKKWLQILSCINIQCNINAIKTINNKGN